MTIQIVIPKRRQERGGPAAELIAANEVLRAKEWCIETDTGGVKIGDGVTHYVSLPYVTSAFFVAATGTNTLAATFAAKPVLRDGLDLRVRAAAANTGAATFNPNSLGALAIKKQGGTALAAGDIAAAGHELVLRYVAGSPGHYELLNPATSAGGTVPTGTGWRHVTGGIEDGAASTPTAADVGAIPSTYLDTDGTLAANSDLKIPSQKAVKTAIANAVTGLWTVKGSTDCSANPNYPSAAKGDAYVVSVAGKIGGASGTSVDVGDVYIALANNAGGTEAAVGASWFHVEHNLVGVALVSSTLAQFAATTSAQLAGVISDETGSGALVFATSPTLTDPVVGTQAAGDNSTKAASTAFVAAAVAAGGGAGVDADAQLIAIMGL